MNSYPLLGHDGAALLCYFFSDPFFPRGPSWFFPASTRKGTTPLLLFCFVFYFREALVQSQVRFNRVPGKVPVKVWEALVQSQVRVPEKVLEKVPGGFGAEPGQVQQGSGEGPGEGSRKPWCKTKWGSTGSVKGSGEGLGGFGAEPGQVQQGSGEGSGEGLGVFGAEPG